MTKPDALLAGATGRTGEALLNGLLASGRYGRIYLLTDRDMRSSTQGVSSWQVAAPLSNEGLLSTMPPAVRDVFVMSFADRLHSARDQAIHAFPAELVSALAKTSAQAGAERLFVVCPITAEAQMSAFKQFFAGAEATLTWAKLPFRRICILLPTEAMPAKQPTGFWQRLRDGYLAQFRLMLPQSTAPFTRNRFAQAVMLVAADECSGISVLGAQELEALSKTNQQSKRLVF